jgi:hypothetical protein
MFNTKGDKRLERAKEGSRGFKRAIKASVVRALIAIIAIVAFSDPFLSPHEFFPNMLFGCKIQCPRASRGKCGALSLLS